MYGYAASSATASVLAPFPAPPNTAAPEAAANQAAAVEQAAAEPAGNTAQSTANVTSQLATPQVLSASTSQAVTEASTTATTEPGPFTWLDNLIQGFLTSGLPTPTNNYAGLTSSMYTVLLKQTTGLGYFSNGLASFSSSIAQQLTFGPGGSTAGASGAWFPTPQFASLGLGNLGGVSHVGAVSAGAGQAARVGMLSVPQHWANLTSAVSPAAVSEVEETPIGAAGAAGAPGAPANGLLRGMPVGGMGRRGAAAGYVNKYGFRYSVLTRPPSAG